MKPIPEKLHPSVWALGWVSLLADTSSEIVHGLLPGFLVSALGASNSLVGLIEGVGEAVALILKVISGPLSDRLKRRRPFVLVGYSMGALSKPLFALAGTPLLLLGAKIFDRAGKGIRGAPRDALIADVTHPSRRGQAFGLRQSLDTVGAFIGPLLAIGLMRLTGDDYRLVFWIATFPGLAAVLVLTIGVKEQKKTAPRSLGSPSLSVLGKFDAAFWIVVAAGMVFQMARFSEAFLILRARSLGLSLVLAPTVLVAMNLVYSISAYPIGWLSDRHGRSSFLLLGALALVTSDLTLASASGLNQVFAGICLWGMHMGLTQGIFAALVAETSPERYRGTAYGLFNLSSAAALLAASVLAGFLWDHHGPKTMFLVSACLALAGSAVLFACHRFVTRTAKPE